MARKRARSSATDEPQAPTVPTATPLRRSNRSTRATQSFRDITDDEDESQRVVKRQRKADKRTQMPRHKTSAKQSPPAARYNTRSKQIQSPEMDSDIASDEDEADVEELPTWPRYKDDLPNAFNGEVDASQDFISKAPVEIIDNILSFLLLDHDPERGIKIREGTYKARSHVLISMAAMSRLFYHATEGFAYKFLTKNKEDLTRPYVSTWDLEHPELHQAILARAEEYRQEREEQLSKVRRSSRLASKPQPQAVKVHRMELVRVLQSRCAACFDAAWTQGKFANTVSVCGKCEWSINGQIETLTEALRNYDLRDYMLLKTRKPGPRAKFTNLPTITSASEFKALGFPAFRNMTVFSFRSKDLRMLADLVHGDWRQHMAKKWQERASRQDKARTKRVRQFIIQYHERELEVSKGREAKRHQKRLDKLRSIPLDEKEDGLTSHFGCTRHFCYHDIGLCSTCGDVPGRDTEECPECDAAWMDRRFEQFYGRSLAQSGSGNQGA